MGDRFWMGWKSLEVTPFFIWMARVSAMFWLFGVSMFVYWEWFDDINPVVIHDITIIHEGPIHPGDEVNLHVDLCQLRPGVPGTGVRMIRGAPDNAYKSYTRFMSESYVDPLVECTRHDRPIKLPGDLEPGDHFYVFQALYQINPIKQKVFTQPPIRFTVVAKGR